MLQSPSPGFLKVFGDGLAVADFDDGGVDDLAVGEAAGGDPPTPGAHGSIHVFSGGTSFGAAPSFTMTSDATGLGAGIFGRLMAVGDLDADGTPDIAVGLGDATTQGLDRAGRVEVFRGPAYAAAEIVESPTPKAFDYFGSRVAVGDVTGDGIDDLVEGSGRSSVGSLTQAGRLHVYGGPALSYLTTIDAPEPTKNQRFGETVRTVDLDGDAVAEIVVADVKDHFYVVRDAAGTPWIGAWTKPPSPNPAVSHFGFLFTFTDGNGDGLLDIVVSDPPEGDTPGCGIQGAGGAFYLALGPYYATALRYSNPLSECLANFGWDFIAEDLDGDGTAELIAGDRVADINGISNPGRIFIIRR